MSHGETAIHENARLELLRSLALWKDICERRRRERPEEAEMWEWKHIPLFCSLWENRREEISLAAKECAALGEIDMVTPDGTDQTFDLLVRLEGPPVKITDKGYDWIKARDAIGEAEQEPLR